MSNTIPQEDICSEEKGGECSPRPQIPRQIYEQLKSRLLLTGQLFEDPYFKTIDENIFFSRRPPRLFVWKRPGEICNDPKLFADGGDRFDIVQGMIGNCWFLSGVASLTQNKNLLYKVVPIEQGWGYGYAGIFQFWFWQFGEWVDIVIDDRLPTYDNKLVFLHSRNKNEFWSALLEKAYAKLCGSYESLKGGMTTEGMEDLTGGVCETYDIKKCGPDLFPTMLKLARQGALMGCSIATKTNAYTTLSNGLVMGHAYSVTGVRKISIPGGLEASRLVRVRNPWGNEREWNGAWSDKSLEWTALSDSDKRQLELDFNDDGEFWMSFEDFCSNFTTVEVCLGGPTSKDGVNHWESKTFSGSWYGPSAGGSRNFPDTFHKNPQIRIKLEDDANEDGKCTVIIALMQCNRRRQKVVGRQNLTMGFAIYNVTKKKYTGRLDRDFFLYNACTARSPSFINSRDVVGRFQLEKGDYVIVPSTFKSGEDGDFILRLFSEKYAPGQEKKHEETRGPHERSASISSAKAAPMQKELLPLFKKLVGSDDTIDRFELQSFMTAFFKETLLGESKFSLEPCREIITLLDDDRDGKLSFDEFQRVVSLMTVWKKAFSEYDKDGSGRLDAIELTALLSKFGFNMSTSEKNQLMLKYSGKTGHITLADFSRIICKFIFVQGEVKKLDEAGKSSISLHELRDLLIKMC